MTFDTNALNSAPRLDGLLDWVIADLAASTARWKIIYGHHPLAGVPDKPESPAGAYYQQVVNRLKAAGVDLFMTGHSHTYSWTYPLTGQVEGVATYEDHGADDHFHAGVGLTQLVSGVGGVGVRSGDYGQFPFVAEGFSASTPVAARLGFSQIDVTADALTVKYVAADDGAVIDSFRIEKEDVQSVSFQQGISGYAGTSDTMLREDAPATSEAAAPSLKVDADNPAGTGRHAQALLRFASLFGSGPGLIPSNAVLRSATLTLHVTNGGDTMNLHRMVADWSPSATWNSLGAGIQADGIEAVAFADTSTGVSEAGDLAFNVLASLRAWQSAPASNRGWAVLPTAAGCGYSTPTAWCSSTTLASACRVRGGPMASSRRRASPWPARRSTCATRVRARFTCMTLRRAGSPACRPRRDRSPSEAATPIRRISLRTAARHGS